nr:MAG TPA: hypothetical protein [Inoviridae sp.]
MVSGASQISLTHDCHLGAATEISQVGIFIWH